MRPRLLACVAGALLAVPAAAYDPTGELTFRVRGSVGTGASFDAERLVGPTVNLTRQEGGGWAGDIAGQNVRLEVTDRRVSGANVDLHLAAEGRKRMVRGNFFGQRLWLEYTGKKLSGRVGDCSLSLSQRRAGLLEGDIGCLERAGSLPRTAHAILQLAGDAAQPDPPMPQFALALVALLAG
jgi:hypothetical protein